jgi:general stress protein CsbA
MGHDRFTHTRLIGLALVLLLFGAAFVVGVVHYGDHPAPLKVAPTIFAIFLGLFAIAGTWQASRFTYAHQVALAMAVLFLVAYPLRLVTDHVDWVGLARNGLVVAGGLVLTFGRGKTDDDLPMAKMNGWTEARGLPKLNQRRARRGLPPVASFDEARAERRRR